MTEEQKLEMLRPKDEKGFQLVLYEWLRGFHERHLADLEHNLSQIQQELFLVKWHDTR